MKNIKTFESFINEMYDTDGESPYDNGDMYETNDYKLVVDLNERGEYAATVYDHRR
jgi:hypothetical protein